MPHLDPAVIGELFGNGADIGHLALTGQHGVVLPPFTDHHVHLQLIDEHALAARGIAGVVDLGGDPFALVRRVSDGIPRTAYAGAFLSAPGGYPTGRPWADDAMIRSVDNASRHPGVAGGAATAVDEQLECGARVIKLAMNADAGPVPSPEVLGAVVAHAHERGVPVVAHVQGAGMYALALGLSVDVLAHAPFTEPLSTDAVARAVTQGQRWISTLDIHRDDSESRRIALANLAMFRAAGGDILYGTDLGNGELPVGVNPREVTALVEAGLTPADVVGALTAPWPYADAVPGVCSFVPGRPPADPRDLGAWLATASTVPIEEIAPDEP